MAATIIPFPPRPAPDRRRQRQLATDAEVKRLEAHLEYLLTRALAGQSDSIGDTADGRLAKAIAARIEAAPPRR